MTTIGLSYSLVKISTKCAPALGTPVGCAATGVGWRTHIYGG